LIFLDRISATIACTQICSFDLWMLILYLNADLSNGKSYYTGSNYQVEARARVLFFDVANLEVDLSLHRTKSVLSQVGGEMLRSHSKEHAGLLSWPESFYRSPRGPQKDSQNEIESPAKGSTFSARALQLSMYGSMVCSLV
jgi:hypothetical protein